MFSNITELVNLWSKQNFDNPEQDAKRCLEKIWNNLKVSPKTKFKSFDTKKGLLTIEVESLFLIVNLQLQSKSLIQKINTELTKEYSSQTLLDEKIHLKNLRFKLKG